jgi:hypothetical protein
MWVSGGKTLQHWEICLPHFGKKQARGTSNEELSEDSFEILKKRSHSDLLVKLI